MNSKKIFALLVGVFLVYFTVKVAMDYKNNKLSSKDTELNFNNVVGVIIIVAVYWIVIKELMKKN